MFSISDNAISPLKGRFEHALPNLEAIHGRAQDAALSHLRDHLVQTAQDAGLPHEPIDIFGDAVGISNTPLGDKLAEHEYGTPTSDAPAKATLRNSLRREMPHAQGLYESQLYRGMGF